MAEEVERLQREVEALKEWIAGREQRILRLRIFLPSVASVNVGSPVVKAGTFGISRHTTVPTQEPPWRSVWKVSPHAFRTSIRFISPRFLKLVTPGSSHLSGQC